MNFKDIAITATAIARANTQLTINKEPLMSLSTSVNVVDFFPRTGANLELTTDNLASIVEDTVTAASDNIDDLSDVLSQVVTSAVLVFRDSVNPAIKELSDALKTGLDALDSIDSKFGNNKDASERVKLLDIPAPVVYYSQLFDLPSVRGMTYPTARQIRASETFRILPDLRYTHGDIFTNISTDNPDMDRVIHQWLAEVNPDELQGVLNLFTDDSNLGTIVEFFNPKTQNKLELVNSATYAILICDKYLRNVSPDATGMSLAAYKFRLKQIKDVATITLAAGVNMLRTAMRLKYLVISKRSDYIVVLRENYYNYVEHGGSVSSLIGYHISGSNDKKLDKLITTIADDTTRYDLSQSVEKRTKQRKRQNFVRNTVFNTFMKLFKEEELSKAELDYYDGLSFESIKPQVQKRLRATLDSLDTAEFLNLDILSLKLVCRSRFFFTGAEEYLMSMVDIHTAKPGITIDDIRYIANIQYISRYLSGYLDKSKIY